MLPIFVVVRSLEWQLSRLASLCYIHANQSTRLDVACVCVSAYTKSACVLHTNTVAHTQSHWPVGHTSLHSTWPTCSDTFCCESLSLSPSLFVLSLPFSAWFCSLATVLTIAIVNVCFVNGFDKFFCCNYST